MRFLFVDKITELKASEARGYVDYAADDPMRYADSQGEMQISPAIISEAVGQLCSWLVIKETDFRFKPVYLFSDRINILKPVKPGTRVELHSWIQQRDEETCKFSGEAFVAGEKVLSIDSCTLFLMALEQLEDPQAVRQRFAELMTADMRAPVTAGVAAEAASPYNFKSLVDEVVRVDFGKSLTARKKMRGDEPFYRDHFPRFPVTPAVLINEMIGRATALALEDEPHLIPVAASHVKVRSFIRPDEECEVTIKIEAKSERQDGKGHDVTTVGEIRKEGKVILRGQYSYRMDA